MIDLPDNINMYVPWFLMSSYLYYEWDCAVLPDNMFDVMCVEMLKNWDDIEHMHKHLITKEHLKAGSGYDIIYPLMVKLSAREWFESHKGFYPEEQHK